MDVSTTSFSPTQMILAWSLLALLVSWFIIFIALAIRDYIMKKVEWEDIPTTSSSIPIMNGQLIENHQNLVGIAGNTQNQERANSGQSRDNGTTLFR